MALMLISQAVFLSLRLNPARATTLPSIPTLDFNATSESTLSLSSLEYILIDQRFHDFTDDTGHTLIPPTLAAFARTFSEDYSTVVGKALPVETGETPIQLSIFLTLSNDTNGFLDAAGRPTAEGYMIDVSTDSVTITGASPLGAWWGTRSLLQIATLGNMSLPIGSALDAPGWATRRMMLDAARHFYPIDFLISLCNYMSFFKQNVFHVHLSDNLNTHDFYTRDRSLVLYAAFRLISNESVVDGLVKPWRVNETYSREEFDELQKRCAARGVTVIPEIEAPGHALVIAQWKPQLGLKDDLSLLNISHPETIPTMKDIWRTFLPWFYSKVVHIGADEYDTTLGDDYNFFVNTMASFISETSGQTTRIWGTNAPGRNSTVDKSVNIQHWALWESNPLELLNQGYRVLNSDEKMYIVNKWSKPYPQKLNLTRIFQGNPAGGAFAPFVFDVNNSTNNPSRGHPNVEGHIAALWNDWGQNTTTYSEAWYSWREGLAGLADKQWGGKLTLEQYNDVFPKLHPIAPAQNLDKTVPSKTDVIFEYDFSTALLDENTIEDLSGNGYHATCTPSCRIDPSDGSISLEGEEFLTTPLSTKGREYTLSFTVKISPSTPIGSPIFTGADSTLQHGNGTNPNLMLITSVNEAYPLNLTLPTGVWNSVALVERGNATFLTVNETEEMEFLAVLGVIGNDPAFEWKEIGVEAPIARIGGDGFIGNVANVTLLGRA